VTRVTDLADIQKNTLEVKVAIEDPAPELKPAMLARVRFLEFVEAAQGDATKSGTLSVFAPASALDGGTAWLITQFDGEEGIAERRSVTTTGAEEDGWREIETGIQPGDLLILSPPDDLQPRQRVRVRQKRSD